MILRSVKLENIRSYISESIVFPEGSVLLSGDIGSGKSTILLAVEFALFGILRAELSGNSLLRHGKSQGSVELKFNIGNKDYIIKRTLKKARNSVVQDSGYILEEGKKYEGTPIELKAKIIRILGYPEQMISSNRSLIYRYTVYTPQEEMKHILFDDKEIRLDTLRRLFGIDKYKVIKENASFFIREIRAKRREISARAEIYTGIEDELKEKKQRAEKTGKEVSSLVSRVAVVKELFEKEKSSLEQTEKEIKRRDEIRQGLEIINARLADKKKALGNIEKTLNEKAKHLSLLEKKQDSFKGVKDLVDEKPMESELNRMQEKLESFLGSRSVKAEKIRATEERISALEREMQELSEAGNRNIQIKAELTELEQKLASKEKQEEMLQSLKEKEKRSLVVLEGLKAKIKECDRRIAALEDDKCPVCGQLISPEYRASNIKKDSEKRREYDKEAEAHKGMLEKISANIKIARSNLEKLSLIEIRYRKKREKFAALQESLKQLVAIQKEISSLYPKKKELEKELLEFDSEKEGELRKAIEKKRELLSQIRDNNIKFREKANILEALARENDAFDALKREEESLRQEIKALENQKDDAAALLEKYDGIDNKHENQKRSVEDAREKLNSLGIKLASLEQEKISLLEQVEILEKKSKELEKLKKQEKYFTELENWIEGFFLRLITTMEKHVMISIHREFSSLLQEWFSVLVDDLHVMLDDEFSPVIIQDGYETGIENLSGGEKTSVALAYRLALNKVVNDLIQGIRTKDIIILDEPTDGFSSEQLDKVKDVLDQLNMRQTIIVSHEQKMESYVQNIIRIEKNEGISRALT